MKIKPQLADLQEITPDDDFTKALIDAHTAPKMTYRKSFTMDQASVDILNEITVKLTNNAGRTVTASEALRVILSSVRGK